MFLVLNNNGLFLHKSWCNILYNTKYINNLLWYRMDRRVDIKPSNLI